MNYHQTSKGDEQFIQQSPRSKKVNEKQGQLFSHIVASYYI